MTSREAKADEMKSAAARVAEDAKAQASETAKDVKSTVAARADHEADKVARAGAEFEGSPYAEQAAEQISATLSQVADAVRSADLGAVQDDVSAFARRNPTLFFGGAMALGFLAARATKASERAEISTQAAARHDYPSVPEGQRAYPDQNARRWGAS